MYWLLDNTERLAIAVIIISLVSIGWNLARYVLCLF